ncbi:RNA polymerase III RPC4-domain-containing protein [Obelidium mucronatum]|nr:RNA polymerase III RPC4-domain-containing protein [Obelidium mucronatum]
MPPRLVSLRDKRAPAKPNAPPPAPAAAAAAVAEADVQAQLGVRRQGEGHARRRRRRRRLPSAASAATRKDRVRPRREMLPRTRIEDTMLPSNLAGNNARAGAAAAKSALGGRASGGGGGSGSASGYGGAADKVKAEPGGFGEYGGGGDDDKDAIGRLDERDLAMIADSFAVGDEDAPVSLGWSRRVRDREHFMASKASSDVKVDAMVEDNENELQSFNEFVQPEQKQLFFFQLPKKLPHFDGLETSLTGTGMDPSGDLDMSSKSEGLIGKILVHRSGKMKLVLGSISLDVDVVPYSDCVQEAMAIDTVGKTSCILGKVSKRFICTPDINDLLES